jgi:hypothetical protein
MDLFIPNTGDFGEGLIRATNFTLHCKANTTRGYFELGNSQNNFTYGPLLQKWPSVEEVKLDFNDLRNAGYDYAYPMDKYVPAREL